MYESEDRQESITMVGDWFFAQSVSAKQGHGYRQTVFTRHAPTVRAQIEEFDDEFEELLAARKWSAAESRQKAIAVLRREIAKCERVATKVVQTSRQKKPRRK